MENATGAREKELAAIRELLRELDARKVADDATVHDALTGKAAGNGRARRKATGSARA